MDSLYSRNRKITWRTLSLLFTIIFTLTTVEAQIITNIDIKLADNSDEGKYLNNLLSLSSSALIIDSSAFQTETQGSPIILNVNTEDYSLLLNTSIQFKEVELLNLQVDDTDQQRIYDLALLEGFDNLIFLNIIFTTEVCQEMSDECIKQHILSHFRNIDAVPFITYKKSVPN